MTISQERKRLDDALTKVGKAMILRRPSGLGVSFTYADVTVKGRQDVGSSEELVDGQRQQKNIIVISPTPLIDANWPTGTSGQWDLPKKGDFLSLNNVTTALQGARPFWVGEDCARIELDLLGESS